MRSSPARLALLVLIVPLACARIERTSGIEPLEGRRLLARATIGAAGGTVAPARASDLHARVRLVVPAGALAQDVEIAIQVRYGDPRLPSVVQSFELEPRGLDLALPAAFTAEYASAYEISAGAVWNELDIAAWSFATDPARDLRLHDAIDRDVERNLVTMQVDVLGTCFCMHRELRALTLPGAELVDPSSPMLARFVGELPVETVDGPRAFRIGRGTLDGFFAGVPSRNLLVVPGVFGDALLLAGDDALLPQDATEGLNGDFDNIVVFRYAAGRAIRENGNRLYDLLARRIAPGFRCDAIAHGGGGLVLRWALERAHADPSRADYREGDRPLVEFVDRVVLLATPNDGAPVVALRFEAILAATYTSDARFVQGLADLIPGRSTLIDELGNAPPASSARYFSIAGDVAGGGNDGLVDVSSAVGSPGSWPHLVSHFVFSGPGYDHFALIAGARRTGVTHQARLWLDKITANSRPTVGAVLSPVGVAGGVIEVPYSLADADADICSVAAVWTVDGAHWFIATPANGGGYVQAKNSTPAPGLGHVFHWHSVADRIGAGAQQRAVLRIVASDGGGYGVVGETGWFAVQN
ncbi:MAG: hypothetical protein HZB39_18515 [Planctomycetes bacterium]|nr:hypothetical protein [Planctomycetota bacterium]